MDPLSEKALQQLEQFDVRGSQARMDDEAAAIQDAQSASLSSRKQLAAQTKAFKALDDSEKLDQMNTIIKAYQVEIDNLNKRAKGVETAFFKVYRGVSELPDLNPILSDLVQKSKAGAKVSQLEKENADLKQKLLQMADYDNLKSKIDQTTADNKASVEKELKLNDDKWSSVLEERELNWKKEQNKLESTVDSLKSKLQESLVNEKMLKKKLTSSEIAFDDTELTSAEDYGENTDIVEFNLIKKELESAKSNLAILQKRNEELRKEVISSNSKSDLEISKFKQSQRNEHSNLESEISLISAKLQHERDQNAHLKSKMGEMEDESNNKVEKLTTELAALKSFRDKTSDYDELKRELEILKQIQFGDDDDDDYDDGDGGNQNNQGKQHPPSSVDPIESAIVQRNRKLNDELVEMRNKTQGFEKQLQLATDRITELSQQLEKLESENSNLENQLMRLDSRGNNAVSDKWETMSMISSIVPTSKNGKISPAASIAGGIEEITPTLNGQYDTLLPIITQQRDRFRSRNRELEEENKKHFSKLMELKREISALKTDNKELYEKIQFIKFHNGSAPASSTLNIDKYQDDYEKQLHPIEKFRLMESERISSKISPLERIFIQVTKTVLSTQYTRWLFVGYCITLHILVMILSLTLVSSSPAPIVSQAAMNSATGGKSS